MKLNKELNKLKIFTDIRYYGNWISNNFVNTIRECDLLLLTGGEDIHPSLYNEKIHPQSYHNLTRDLIEKQWFEKAVKLGKPILGICRGSQLLCILNGGRLIQHQQNKYHIHPIELYDNTKIDITSTHHQAQYPFNLPNVDYNILGWTKGISDFHQDGEQNEMSPRVECEIVYYKKTNSLGIQGHPEDLEWNKYSESIIKLQNIVLNELFKKQ